MPVKEDLEAHVLRNMKTLPTREARQIIPADASEITALDTELVKLIDLHEGTRFHRLRPLGTWSTYFHHAKAWNAFGAGMRYAHARLLESPSEFAYRVIPDAHEARSFISEMAGASLMLLQSARKVYTSARAVNGKKAIPHMAMYAQQIDSALVMYASLLEHNQDYSQQKCIGIGVTLTKISDVLKGYAEWEPKLRTVHIPQ